MKCKIVTNVFSMFFVLTIYCLTGCSSPPNRWDRDPNHDSIEYKNYTFSIIDKYSQLAGYSNLEDWVAKSFQINKYRVCAFDRESKRVLWEREISSNPKALDIINYVEKNQQKAILLVITENALYFFDLNEGSLLNIISYGNLLKREGNNRLFNIPYSHTKKMIAFENRHREDDVSTIITVEIFKVLNSTSVINVQTLTPPFIWNWRTLFPVFRNEQYRIAMYGFYDKGNRFVFEYGYDGFGIHSDNIIWNYKKYFTWDVNESTK